MSTYKIIERDGKLFVQDAWQNHYSKPIRYRQCWPTGVCAKAYRHLIGKDVRLLCFGASRFVFEDGLHIEMEFGSETKSDSCEQEPIPKPKGAKEYWGGAWRK